MSISGPGPSTPPPKPRRRPSLRSIAERNVLATANTGLVGVTLERYFPGIPAAARDDAFQSGLLGLLRAAELFDPARGFAFSTYAVRWIRQAIGRSGDERHLIRLPQRLRGVKRQHLRARLQVARLGSERAGNLPGRAVDPGQSDGAVLAAEVLRRLHPRDARVLRERFYRGRTLDEVAKMLGLCKERVRQIQERALERARLLMGADAKCARL